MISKEAAYSKISDLVNRFSEQYESYSSAAYNEALTRKDFIDPFFEALGWDMNNRQGYAEAYREVIHEDKLKIGKATKAPDYSFKLPGGKRLFFVEAKKPSVYVKDAIDPAYQLRRYAWSDKMAVSILTDFEEFAVYDCTKKPLVDDKASVARIRYITYKDYHKEFDFLWDTFSKERVLKGSFDKFIQSDTYKKGTATVDKAFLESLDKWRTYLATSIAINNKNLDEDEINFAVQHLIDRIIFLRIAEDRAVEPYGSLKLTLSQGELYKNLFHVFEKADEKYNSGLFDFKKDKISAGLVIENKIIRNIINDLYYPESPYEFSVMSVEILGSAYEQFLGKQIKITPAHHAKIEEKPEVRKAGGVYYTPQYIVEYIVKNTLGKLIEGKTPKEISSIKTVDPACGSGSFLIGAYDYLLKWHLAYYHQHPVEAKKAKALTPSPSGRDGVGLGYLTTAEKKRILLNNIYGVDIDVNAVEVTKLSLLLKCMEGETAASIAHQMSFFHERILPSLDNNIKDGNSLIDTDYYSNELDFGEDKKVKPFNWQKGFSEVFKNGGFDVVIGNPPYIPIEFFNESEKGYYKSNYPALSRKYETSVLFILRGLNLLNEKGTLGFISTQTWQTGENYANFRMKIFNEYGIKEIINLPFNVFKDAYVDTGIFIFTKRKRKAYSFFAFGKKNSVSSISDFQFEQIETKDIQGPDYKLILNKEVTKLTKRFNSNNFIELGNISISTQGLSASRFTETTNIQNEWTFPFITATVKRYSFKQENQYWVNLENIKSLQKFYKQEDKILVRRIINRQNKLDATFFNKKGVFKKDLNPFIIIDEKFDAKYILALLNSNFFSWLYLNISSIASKDDFRQTTLAELRKLPIRKIDLKNKIEIKHQDEIIKNVDQLLKLNEELQTVKLETKAQQIKSRIDYCEGEINKAVYKLYDLSEEEIKIVERK